MAKTPELIEAAVPPAEEIAASIVRISDAAEKLLKSGLNEDLLVLLLSDMSKVGKTDVRYVLRNLPLLKKRWLVQPKK